jgi:hypothetical protein
MVSHVLTEIELETATCMYSAERCKSSAWLLTGTVDFLRGLELTRDELDKAIIGTIGDIDAYQLPDAKGRTAFMRHILGITDEERQLRRQDCMLQRCMWGSDMPEIRLWTANIR